MKNKTPFPILVMTKDEGEHLRSCIESLIETIERDVSIYIVDNCSTTSIQKEILDELSKNPCITVVYNKYNRWVIGLNDTLRNIRQKHKDWECFLLTDGDIQFHKFGQECWLKYLIDKMQANVAIGKVGFSLDWSFIEKDPWFKNILNDEKRLYNENKKINEFYVSPVDTTAALIRFDWSIEGDASFYPDHMRYLRPELYSCRTPRNMTVTHLGWFKYKDNQKLISRDLIDQKVICFTLMGATIQKEILHKASRYVFLFHRLFARSIYLFWVFRRYFYLFRYILKKGKTKFDGQEQF